MKERVITGVIAAVLLVALIYKGPLWLVAIVVLAFSAMAYFEYDRLFFDDVNRARLLRVWLYLAASLWALAESTELWACSAWLVFIVHCAWHVSRANAETDLAESVRRFRVEFFGYLYCTALFGFLIPIFRIADHGRDYLLLLFLVVSLGDTAAYFFGRYLGRRKLASQISPKKTIEGALGGTLASTAIAYWWVRRIYHGDPRLELTVAIVGFGFIGSILAQLGDLFESLLKRSRAAKDSGGLLPGHGGILDRTDGLALAAPALYFYLKYVLARYL